MRDLILATPIFAARFFCLARPGAASCPGVVVGFETGRVAREALAYSFLQRSRLHSWQPPLGFRQHRLLQRLSSFGLT